MEKIVEESNSDAFEALRIRPDGADACYLYFSVCRLGNFLSAGRTSTVTVRIEDSDDIRALAGHLYHLKTCKFYGVVRVTFNEGQYYTMDQSLWIELADGLLAFATSIDCAKLGI